MPRPTKEAYELSDAEKRDLIQLIQQNKPLPEKYRFVLFEDKREVELVWNGKTLEVCTTICGSSRWSPSTSRARNEGAGSPVRSARQADAWLDQRAQLGRQPSDGMHVG